MKNAIYGLFSLIIFSCGGDGEPGPNGEPGPSGFEAIITTRTLENGDSNCPDGGVMIESGTDNGDGGGIAGNGILEEGEIDNSDPICSGTKGPVGNDDPTNSFYFENKTKGAGVPIGYDDLSFSNINNQMPTTRVEPYRLKLIIDNTTVPYEEQRSLIKFDSISKVIIPETTDDFVVNMVILYVFLSTGELTNREFTYIGANAIFNRIGGNAMPVYDPQVVTWYNASRSNLWLFPGVYNLGVPPIGVPHADDRQRIEVEDKFNFSSRWLSFLLNREQVAKWIASDSENRGILLSILEADGVDAFLNARVEFDINRPILFINAEEIPSSGRLKATSNEEYRAYWKSLTEAEKLTPLKDYLLK